MSKSVVGESPTALSIVALPTPKPGYTSWVLLLVWLPWLGFNQLPVGFGRLVGLLRQIGSLGSPGPMNGILGALGIRGDVISSTTVIASPRTLVRALLGTFLEIVEVLN
jgi:hypothetical protein